MKTVVVAGAGVVGLSIARAVARRGFQVFVLEKNERIGMETSSRNSEVIHAGIYYPQNSWKARMCVQGKKLLYQFCNEFDVTYRRCGKLIVAQHGQVDELRELAARGAANCVDDLRLISRQKAQSMEPLIECEAALYSPSTGIVDSHGLMLALQYDAEAHGAAFAYLTVATDCVYNPQSQSVEVDLVSSSSREVPLYDTITCDYFVNATGLFAPSLHHQCRIVGVDVDKTEWPTMTRQFAKGTYFRLRKSAQPFSHLVYPIPQKKELGGLGVHATIDLQGHVRFGPDVEWIDTVDYEPDPKKVQGFAQRIQEYYPHISAGDLETDYCGIRPKIEIRNRLYNDFYITDYKHHYIPNNIHLCGIESPGLTSSLAIAEHVTTMIQSHALQ